MQLMDEPPPYRLASSLGLLQIIKKELDELGPRFLYGAGDREQKAREAVAAFFFMAALKKLLKKEYWMLQRPDVEFPDFELASFGGSLENLDLELYHFEIVTVPDHCKTFEEMYSIVSGKFHKNYDASGIENVSLLIFVNNEKSIGWIQRLMGKIGSHKPFKEIWTVHLLFQNEEISATEINRIVPLSPILKQVVSFSDPEIIKPPEIPDYQVKDEDGNFVFTEEFKTKLRKEAMKKKLGKG